jgi:hypothetical protein
MNVECDVDVYRHHTPHSRLERRTARRTQFEASLNIKVRQQNGGHFFNQFGYAYLA